MVAQHLSGSGVFVGRHCNRPGSHGFRRIHARSGTESPVRTRSGVRPTCCLPSHGCRSSRSSMQPKPATRTQPSRCQSAAFTNTEIPKFRGVTCLYQYRQVFDAIVKSNGWDDDMVALQLLSHLEGNALNVALLVPEAQRASPTGLVSALNYGLQGDWRITDANSIRLSAGMVRTRPYTR